MVKVCSKFQNVFHSRYQRRKNQYRLQFHRFHRHQCPIPILYSPNTYKHSHKKRKDSLDRVLLAAELEFAKILAPRLPQHTSDVNIKCATKSEWSKQQYSLYVTIFLEH